MDADLSHLTDALLAEARRAGANNCYLALGVGLVLTDLRYLDGHLLINHKALDCPN